MLHKYLICGQHKMVLKSLQPRPVQNIVIVNEKKAEWHHITACILSSPMLLKTSTKKKVVQQMINLQSI